MMSLKTFFLSYRYYLAAVFGGLLIGVLVSVALFWPYQQKLAQKLSAFDQLLQDKQDLQRDLAASQMENKIASNSSQELRKLFEKQQKQLTEQEKELNFYQHLMAKTPGEKGLVLNSWSMMALPNQHYFYRFAFVQYTKQHYLLNRAVQIAIQGTQQGKEKRYALSELLADSVELPKKLYFRYFQIIEGELILPDGFEPEIIRIDVAAQGKNDAPWQQQIPWQIKDQ